MIKITLGNESLPHIEYEKDGQKRAFHLDHNTLFEFIQQNCFKETKIKKKFEDPLLETPALPPGTVKYMSLPNGNVVLFMEKKDLRHDVLYHKTKFKDVPFPNLLFVFQFSPKENDMYYLQGKHCFAFKNNVLRDDTPLYRFPFSHVSIDGSMCFFFLNELKDLAQMTSFIHNWISVEFTDHYYNQETKNKWGWPLRQIFNKTQGQPHFDYDKLIEENITVKDIAQRFVNRFYPANQQ